MLPVLLAKHLLALVVRRVQQEDFLLSMDGRVQAALLVDLDPSMLPTLPLALSALLGNFVILLFLLAPTARWDITRLFLGLQIVLCAQQAPSLIQPLASPPATSAPQEPSRTQSELLAVYVALAQSQSLAQSVAGLAVLGLWP